MDKTYQKFLKSGIDLAALGVGRGENETYFCTPRGASFIGWEGVDGIHYCFVRGYGGVVFAVSPENAEVFTILWSSSDERIATVADTGKIKAVKTGTATITATSLDGKKTAECKVTVKANTDNTQYTEVFKDNLGDKSVWNGDTDALSGGLSMNYSGTTKKVTSKKEYALGNNFAISMTYRVTGNEGQTWGSYASFEFGGLEVRIIDGASVVELLQGGKSLGKYTGEMNGDANVYTLRYNKGNITVSRGGEKLITAKVSSASLTSAVTVYSGESYRSPTISNITLKKAK